MSGYIIELYKNIISDEKYWTEQRIADSELKNKIYVTFGEFDKMTVSRTNAFSRMRDVSKMSREWIGDRQKILLFELADRNQLEYREMNDTCGFFSNHDGSSSLCTKLFLGITMFQFKDSQGESKNTIKDSLNICRKNILEIVTRQNVSVECSVLGLLGTYGVAVIWAADQFTDILKMINIIKGSDILASEINARPEYRFLSVFTILAKNKDGHNEEKIKELKGPALLQMTLQTNLNQFIIDTIKEKIPEAKNFHAVGEYDLLVETPARNVYKCFEKGKIFDPIDGFYKGHILQTSVKLCESDINDHLQLSDKKSPETEKYNSNNSNDSKENTDTLPYVQEIKRQYEKLRKLFFDEFPKTAGMVDSLDLLYGDYHSQIASVSNKMWAEDYSQQVLAVLKMLKSSLKLVKDVSGSFTTSKVLEEIQDILNCFAYQTIHISESDNLVLDTPKCHLRYTGQNNLILYAYFGIIKDIIELAYHLQEESRQSKIIPLISVDTVPIITSSLFMDNHNPFADRLIKFGFPMVAMYDLPAYVPYLYHEVFHYVAPKDRIVRNWVKGCILAVYAMKNVICWLIYSASKEKVYNIAYEITEKILNYSIYQIVVNQYCDPLIVRVKHAAKDKYTRNVINEKSSPWLQYEERLFELLTKYIKEPEKIMLEENLLYKVLEELYQVREKIMQDCVSIIDRTAPDFRDKEKEISETLGSFLGSLEGLFTNISPEAKLGVFQRLLKSTELSDGQLLGIDQLVQLSDALREAVCDLSMIELSGMDAVAYLMNYVKIQNDLLKQNESEFQVQNSIRIGIALDTIWGWKVRNVDKHDKLTDLKSTFIQSYIGLYFSEKKSTSDKEQETKEYVKTIETEAGGWFARIQNWYQEYLEKYSIVSILLQIIVDQSSVKGRGEEATLRKFEGLKTVQYHNAVRSYGTAILNAAHADNLTEEEKRSRISNAKELFQKEVFGYNIDIILTYQKQKKFKDLNDLCEERFHGEHYYRFVDVLRDKNNERYLYPLITEEEEETCGVQPYVHTVKDINGLFETIQKISDYLKKQGREHFGDTENALWYRGHENVEYKLLPTAMRKFAQHADQEESLRSYQRGVYDEFKFRMDNASEKIDKTGYTECDYLALMQHYSSPTIYLDWTENAISALYFALEAYIDSGNQKKQDEKDAVLYLLHPNLYNEARNQMMSAVKVNSGRKLDRLMGKSQQENARRLPNLSVPYQSEKFGMFLLGELEDEQDIYKAAFEEIKSLSLHKDPENILYLPMAIYASRANERVRAQSGMFMAYNIFTRPSKKKYFDYMALEKIQDFYLSKFPNTSPFLYSIRIDGSVKKEIAGWLKAIGVNKTMVYPELSNLGEKIW